MIDEAWLPKAGERLAQSSLAAGLIEGSGYQAVGIDHFAPPDDTLAAATRNGSLRRNFQGYTDDQCETLVGLGPSSVSQLREGYAQSVTATGDYQRMVLSGELATVRGVRLTDEDHVRAWIIERLMCDFAFSHGELVRRFGRTAAPLLTDAMHHAASDPGGLFALDGDLFAVKREGRPLVRTIAAKFDRYLAASQVRHSAAV